MGVHSANMKFRCCIDLHHGKVKQIVGSTLSDTGAPIVNFESELSSAEFARIYQQDGLTGGHIIMLGGGNQESALAALETYPGGMQVGGGINLDNALQFLEAGASHVIVTSFVFADGALQMDRLEKMVDLVSKEKLVLDLSCRKKGEKYFVVTDRWQKFTDLEVNSETLQMLARYCDEFLVHGVDVEGKRCGIETELVAILGEHSSIPVTYAGGARTIEDLELVKTVGKGKVDLTIGSALDIFGGDLLYTDVVAWDEEQRSAATHSAPADQRTSNGGSWTVASCCEAPAFMHTHVYPQAPAFMDNHKYAAAPRFGLFRAPLVRHYGRPAPSVEFVAAPPAASNKSWMN